MHKIYRTILKTFAKYVSLAVGIAVLIMIAAPVAEAALTHQEQQQVASLLSALEKMDAFLRQLKTVLLSAPSTVKAAGPAHLPPPFRPQRGVRSRQIVVQKSPSHGQRSPVLPATTSA